MSHLQKLSRPFEQTAFALAWLLIAGTPAFAQGSPKQAAEKWRPTEGTYAAPGADFSQRCGEFGDIIVELTENSISGNEWSCKITKRAYTAPDSMTLKMTCSDYNLAEDINDPNPYEREFTEIMQLRNIDGKSVFVRKTLNGKFRDPEWRASYCPEETQRMYIESKARDTAEAEKKAADNGTSQKPWRPQDGIYAIPGTNFDARCRKAGDAIIAFSERSISSGAEKCSATFIRDEPNAIRLFATCSRRPDEPGTTARMRNGGSPAPTSPETIILKKTEDNIVFMQKTVNGDFIDSGRKLSYCGHQDVQKAHTLQKARQ